MYSFVDYEALVMVRMQEQAMALHRVILLLGMTEVKLVDLTTFFLKLTVTQEKHSQQHYLALPSSQLIDCVLFFF